MAITEPRTQTAGEDQGAIEELHEVFTAQKAAFLKDTYPSVAERRSRLEALTGMVVTHRDRIHEALREDFAVHPDALSDMVEVLTVMGRAAFAHQHLEEWMQPESRETDPNFYGTTRAAIVQQPKGVVGNMSPWNFPFDLSLGPLVDILAAGNRAILKPSEYTPACAELLREMVSATYDRDLVAVVTGGLELAKVFPTLRWDHLLYTGNTEVGRLIAKAAAENLTPLTLELGGKSPAFVLDDAVDDLAVGNILGTKMIKNGQMCIAPDFAFVPRGRLDEFVEIAQRLYHERTPEYAASEDCTGIISERHFERVRGLLDEARNGGARVVDLGSERADPATRRMPMALIIDPDESLRVMREEIFGPILPVKTYDDVEEAIEYVNSRERPLGLYVFSAHESAAQDVLDRTVSGGAAVNACAAQGALPSLGFGGVGHSGSGRHHGIDGFREFSNPRGVVFRGEGGMLDAFLPPYGPETQALIGSIFGG
ncbi:MAG TPA: aldehyde dehydrogenase family protein [Solirubrobacteraceae bacterium]|nr:aldehyde dehydrogenase family protein [Solirubrobacteraceae bacterium]